MGCNFNSAPCVTLLLLIFSSVLGVVMADNGKNWQFGFNYTGDWFSGQTDPPKKIIVGGSQHWSFGFNYTEWAVGNAPFYLNDTLVFKYDPPNATTFPHSVYLFPNFRSFWNCDLTMAKMVGNNNQGGGAQGFEFVLQKWQPYYFGCGERKGFHCKVGQMKFAVMPMLRRYR